ncbi:hypothetical protein FRC20_002652 [Serendipita sp. 405]|nr:hypothetical protein FRC20_002652 [Serendipita sp. 405]
MPLEKRDKYAHITMPIMKQVCEEADKQTIQFIHKFETAFTRMPDERGITDQVALLIQSLKAGDVKFHGQRQEGKTGTDFLIEMHFEEDPAVEALGASLKGTSLDVPGTSASGTSLSGTSTPGSGIDSGTTTPGGTRASQRPLAVKSAEKSKEKSATDAKAKAERAARKAAKGNSKSSKRVVYIQAKSYHKKGDDRVAGFTYKGKQKEGEDPKPMQMNLLKQTVRDGRTEYPDAVIVGGYLLYDPEEIVFIPLDEIVAQCPGDCKGNDSGVDKAMSEHFRKMHQERKDQSPGAHPCFMYDIAVADATTIA